MLHHGFYLIVSSLEKLSFAGDDICVIYHLDIIFCRQLEGSGIM